MSVIVNLQEREVLGGIFSVTMRELNILVICVIINRQQKEILRFISSLSMRKSINLVILWQREYMCWTCVYNKEENVKEIGLFQYVLYDFISRKCYTLWLLYCPWDVVTPILLFYFMTPEPSSPLSDQFLITQFVQCTVVRVLSVQL